MKKKNTGSATPRSAGGDIWARAPLEKDDPHFVYGIAFHARCNHQTARKWLAGEAVGRGRADAEGLRERLEKALLWAIEQREQERKAA